MKKQPSNPTEHQHQAALIKWAKMLSGQFPELALLHAIPNGDERPAKSYTGADGKRHRYSPAVQRLKAEGLLPGVFDLFLPVARQGYHGLYIEMKSETGKPSEAQLEFQHAVREQGFKAEICRGWDAARGVISLYLSIGT